MAEAKTGDTVKVNYTGKLENGTVFDTSEQREPLEFVIGQMQLIPKFEEAIVGMNPTETKTVQITSDEAYGPHRDDLVVELDRKQISSDVNPQVGDRLAFRQPNGENVPVTVTDVTEASITVDANHPLAGEDLTFELELVEIVQ